MSKRIYWKKGMPLTDETLRASDEAIIELVGKALTLGSSGRFGLFPSIRPFHISLNIGKDNVDIASLNCLAITKDGHLIDVEYSAKYDNTFSATVPIPNHLGTNELFLTVEFGNQWKQTTEKYEEPVYKFSLIAPNNPIACNALPIAHLINNGQGWSEDGDFVPPCLFITSHPRHQDLYNKFLTILLEMNEKIRASINLKTAMRTFWPLLQQITICADKDRELMTPMMLLGLIQRFICAFTTSCELDDDTILSDASSFYNFSFSPYNPQNVYQKTKDGVEICLLIKDKVEKILAAATEPIPAPKSTTPPFITADQLYQNCRNKSASVTVSLPPGCANVLYSTDGSEPSKKLPVSSQIVIETGFQKHRAPEPDRTVIVKLKAIDDGKSSEVVSYDITLHKDCHAWNGYEI